jgi:REP element-mobilizing transposase RayT
MARPLRIEFAGALYHVTSRGNGQEAIYLEDTDRVAFLTVVERVCGRFNWAIHGYCLMDNHYHLLIETPEGNLARGMRQLNGVYTQQFNRQHKRVGHVFQGRYKAILVQKDAYLLELARYIVLNPVRARMVRSANDWRWSSYRATAGQSESPKWLETEWLLSCIGYSKYQAREGYKAFVAAGKHQPSPWVRIKHQIYLGSDSFVEKMQSEVESGQDLSEIPLKQRRPPAKPLEHFSTTCCDRDVAIAQAYASGGYSMKQIGEHFGLHYSYISRIINRSRRARRKT